MSSTALFVTPFPNYLNFQLRNRSVKGRPFKAGRRFPLCQFSMTQDYSLRVEGNNSMSSPQYTLYPRIEPYRVGELEVSDLHVIYYELSGNPNGLPVVFIHGGPGGGTEPAHRRFFHPNVYKIVLIDQRGCGRSRPSASLEQNTTWDLVSDMELVREAAGIRRWILFGGSWGSTLAIAYAQTHPDRVIAMILRGIFLSRERELRWLCERDGAAMLYPEAFQRYLKGLPADLRKSNEVMSSYHSILSREDNLEERRAAAKAWALWEHTLSSFPREGDALDVAETGCDYTEEEDLALSRLESHYFANRCFFKTDGFLLANEQMAKIEHIRTRIVQGRWDMVCPRKSAYDLAGMFREGCCSMEVIDNAGHSTFEPGIEQALLRASDEFGREFGWMATKGANR